MWKIILINKVDYWMEFRSAGNRASHTYDEEIAQRIFEIAKKFLPHAKNLLLCLELKKMIYVSNYELKTILEIIKKYASDCDVFVFDSRHKGNYKIYSEVNLGK